MSDRDSDPNFKLQKGNSSLSIIQCNKILFGFVLNCRRNRLLIGIQCCISILSLEQSTGQAILKSESSLMNMALGERELDALNS